MNFQTFFPRGSDLSQFHSIEALNLSKFTRFSLHKIWFESFDLYNFFDILQLCTFARQENVYWVPATSFLCLSAKLTVRGGTGENGGTGVGKGGALKWEMHEFHTFNHFELHLTFTWDEKKLLIKQKSHVLGVLCIEQFFRN